VAALTSTAILLEQIADGGEFERLALACLRQMSPGECGTVIHQGVNAEGKPVPAPLDGFTQVPWQDPPLFVAIACTSEKAGTLRLKWLGIAKKPRRAKFGKPTKAKDASADIPKAIESAYRWRRQFPTARFKLFLVTNRGVDDVLLADVAAELIPANITFEIVERSRLAEFLDTSAPGQFLREVFLRVPAVTLSRGLLQECGRRLLADRRHHPDLQRIKYLIPRPVEDELRTAWNNAQTALIWLVSEPGKGKSLAACRELERHSNQDGLALWLTESDIQASTTLGEAMVRAIMRIKPSLRCDDNSAVLNLGGPADRVLVLIDDLNRSDDPAGNFAKIRGWAERLMGDTGGEDGSKESSVVLVCPIWRRHRSGVAVSERKLPHWEAEIEVGDFTEPELVALGQTMSLSLAEQSAIRAIAGNDPYLTGWLSTTAQEGTFSAGDWVKLGAALLLDKQLDNIAAVSPGVGRDELGHAVRAVGRWILENRQLRPEWTTVVNAFSTTKHMVALRALIADGRLLHESEGRLTFSHDRLREMWLARAVPEAFAAEAVHGEVHYAEIIGRAAADGALTPEQLDKLVSANPLALFSAWQLVCAAPGRESRAQILERIRKWLRYRSGEFDDTDWLNWEIARKLEQCDGPEILEIAAQLRPSQTLWCAALRNGSAKAGREYLQRNLDFAFPPIIGDARFASAIGVAKNRHQSGLLRELHQELSDASSSAEVKNSGILLVGYLGLAEGGSWLLEIWNRATDAEKREWIAAMLWSSARCLGEGAIPVWKSVLEVWQSMPEGKSENDGSPRWNVAYHQLYGCRDDWLDDKMVAWIEQQIADRHALKGELASILRSVDTPAALEYAVREAGANRRNNPASRGMGWWFVHERWSVDRGRKPLSSASRARLKAIWDSEEEPIEDRQAAFACWLTNARAEDLPVLRGLTENSPLQEQALPARMRLRDAGCVPILLRLLPTHRWWLTMVPSVWTKQLLEVVTVMLKDYTSGPQSDWVPDAYELLIAIPPADAEALIFQHESKFRSDAKILQAAILVGTPRLHDWVRTNATTQSGIRDKVLEHVFMEICMGRSYQPRWVSRQRYLCNLEPFLDWLTPEERKHSMQYGPREDLEWCRQHILPRLPPEERKAHELSEENLLALMPRLGERNHPRWYAEYFIEAAQRHGWRERDLLRILVAWVSGKNDDARFLLLAACIGACGIRSDLPTLNSLRELAPSRERTSAQREAEIQVRRRVL